METTEQTATMGPDKILTTGEAPTTPRSPLPQAANDAWNGLRKAAVLLASVPEADAEYLLRQLDEPQLVSIAKAARHAPFQSDEQLKVLREMLKTRKRGDQNDAQSQQGNEAERGSLVKRCSIDAAILAKSKTAFSELDVVPVPTLVRILADELPQTIAVVLANIEPQRAAETLERLPTEKQLAATIRIAQMTPPDPKSLLEVATAVSDRVQEINSPPSRPVGGPAHVARIVRHLTSATEKALLANVMQESRELVESVSRHLDVLRQIDRNIAG